MVGIIGDIHGRFDNLKKVIEAYPDVQRWFQVGDMWAEGIPYPDLPSNFHFIQGNHEDWDYIEKLKKEKSPLFLANGSVHSYDIGEAILSVGVLGGNYSPGHYNKKAQNLCGARRRHFVSDDVCSLIEHGRGVKILLTHEAPSPFYKGQNDIGQPIITEIIRKIKPDIHFFGHHHYFKISEVGGVVSIGLEYGDQSFILYDSLDHRIKKVKL